MKFSIIALGAIALCALQQQTFAKQIDSSISTSASEVDIDARGLGLGLGGSGCGSCECSSESSCGGGDSGIDLGLDHIVIEVKELVDGLLKGVVSLIHQLLGLDKSCLIGIGHGSGLLDLDILHLDLESFGLDLDEIIENLIDDGLLKDNHLLGLVRKLLELVEDLLKCLGLELDLTGLLEGHKLTGGKSCEPTGLDLNIVKKILELIQGILKGGVSENPLCKLLEAVGNLLSELLGGAKLTHLDGVTGIAQKRSLLRRNLVKRAN
ncbi:hypothetical protein BJ944DRAFT_273504 [Cunninghamella echinulata]|nr:hypothetical protein BJ944DRAFT_273504 [Cunninghamella echinulata]